MRKNPAARFNNSERVGFVPERWATRRDVISTCFVYQTNYTSLIRNVPDSALDKICLLFRWCFYARLIAIVNCSLAETHTQTSSPFIEITRGDTCWSTKGPSLRDLETFRDNDDYATTYLDQDKQNYVVSKMGGD
jgi:hypothetical protein